MKLWQKTGALGIFSFSCRRPLSSRSRYFGGSGTTASCRCYYYFCSRDRENNRGAKEEAAHNTAWLQQRYQLLSLLLTQTPKVFYSSTKIFKVHFPSMNNSFPLACCCLVKIQFYSTRQRKIAWDVNFLKVWFVFDEFINLSQFKSLKILRIFQAFFQVKSGLEKIVKSNKV